MAYPTRPLIDALNETARRLENGAEYAWGNHGACNCGNLLQVACSMTKQEIMRFAQTGSGEWTEIAEEYCGTTNLPLDQLVGQLIELGLTPTDIHNIEYLEDRDVLKALPGGFRWLQRNIREDVIVYLKTFVLILEDKLMLLEKRSAEKSAARIAEVMEEEMLPV
jgi:hypothetical protein